MATIDYSTRYGYMFKLLYPHKNGRSVGYENPGDIQNWSPHNVRSLIISPALIAVKYYTNSGIVSNYNKYFEIPSEVSLKDMQIFSSNRSAYKYILRVLTDYRQFSDIEEIIFCDYENCNELLQIELSHQALQCLVRGMSSTGLEQALKAKYPRLYAIGYCNMPLKQVLDADLCSLTYDAQCNYIYRNDISCFNSKFIRGTDYPFDDKIVQVVDKRIAEFKVFMERSKLSSPTISDDLLRGIYAECGMTASELLDLYDFIVRGNFNSTHYVVMNDLSVNISITSRLNVNLISKVLPVMLCNGVGKEKNEIYSTMHSTYKSIISSRGKAQGSKVTDKQNGKQVGIVNQGYSVQHGQQSGDLSFTGVPEVDQICNIMQLGINKDGAGLKQRVTLLLKLFKAVLTSVAYAGYIVRMNGVLYKDRKLPISTKLIVPLTNSILGKTYSVPDTFFVLAKYGVADIKNLAVYPLKHDWGNALSYVDIVTEVGLKLRDISLNHSYLYKGLTAERVIKGVASAYGNKDLRYLIPCVNGIPTKVSSMFKVLGGTDKAPDSMEDGISAIATLTSSALTLAVISCFCYLELYLYNIGSLTIQFEVDKIKSLLGGNRLVIDDTMVECINDILESECQVEREFWKYGGLVSSKVAVANMTDEVKLATIASFKPILDYIL